MAKKGGYVKKLTRPVRYMALKNKIAQQSTAPVAISLRSIAAGELDR